MSSVRSVAVLVADGQAGPCVASAPQAAGRIWSRPDDALDRRGTIVVLGGALAAFLGLLAAGLLLNDLGGWLPRALLLSGVVS